MRCTPLIVSPAVLPTPHSRVAVERAELELGGLHQRGLDQGPHLLLVPPPDVVVDSDVLIELILALRVVGGEGGEGVGLTVVIAVEAPGALLEVRAVPGGGVAVATEVLEQDTLPVITPVVRPGSQPGLVVCLVLIETLSFTRPAGFCQINQTTFLFSIIIIIIIIIILDLPNFSPSGQ